MCYMSPAFLTFLFLVAFIHVFHSTPTDQPYSLRCWLFPRRSPLITYPTDCAALQGEKLELHVLRFRKPCFFSKLFCYFSLFLAFSLPCHSTILTLTREDRWRNHFTSIAHLFESRSYLLVVIQQCYFKLISFDLLTETMLRILRSADYRKMFFFWEFYWLYCRHLDHPVAK